MASNYNGTQSAILCGLASPDNASGKASALLKEPAIKLYLAELTEPDKKQAMADAQYVKRRMMELDQLDFADLLDDADNVLPIRKWPKAWRTLISSVEFERVLAGKIDGKVVAKNILKKFKIPDKLKNLELLGRHVSVQAWGTEFDNSEDAPPLHISFEVSEAKRDITVTRGKPHGDDTGDS